METLENIHWLDYTIGGLVASGLILGLCQGMVRMVVRLSVFVAALYASFIYHDQVTGFLIRKLPAETPVQLCSTLAYGGVFFATCLALGLAVHLIRKVCGALTASTLGDSAKMLEPGLGLKALNRLAGAGIGAILAGLVAGTMVWGMSLVNDPQFQANLEGSKLRPVVLKEMETVLAAVPEQYKEELRRAVQRLHQTGLDTVGQLGGQGAHLLAELMNKVSK